VNRGRPHGVSAESPPAVTGGVPRGEENTITERLHRARLAYGRLTGLSFPLRFPVVQFPNFPLTVAFLAGLAGRILDPSAYPWTASVSALAMTIWAYEELAHGVNWFRRLLGLVFLVLLTIRVAHFIHP
jgi:hypothetical protein